VLLGSRKLARCERPKSPRRAAAAVSESGQGVSLDHKDDAFVDCLGRKLMIFTEFEAEDVTWKIEGTDLAPTVVENFVGSHRAADNLVDIVRRLVLPVDLGVAQEPHWRSHQIQLIDEVVSTKLRRWRGS
jgi:hypothetical protein